jgi:hypothetical protein
MVNKPGLWESPVYGSKGSTTEYMCGPGEVVTHIVGFYGQNNDSNTNAFTAFCKPLGKENINPIMEKATCGKRDYPDIGQGFKDFWNSFLAIINIDFRYIYQRDFGRKVYKHNFASTERGFTSWTIKKKDNEIHGIRFRSKDQTELVAGGQDPNSTYKEYTGECPPGKVIVGFRAGCGDRVDRLQVLCDAETHTNKRSLKKK